MGLLDDTTHAEYYQGNNYGSYQFVSLDDIITQFQIMYIGEDKLIPKAKRADVAFHAQRALAELSFDTLKSFKSQQIDLPPSLTMILPHDYVNYTKVSWADSAGIKRPMYPTKHTSNPFQVKQEEGGEYTLGGVQQLVTNPVFNDPLFPDWLTSDAYAKPDLLTGLPIAGSWVDINDGSLRFRNAAHTTTQLGNFGLAQAAWQIITHGGADTLELTATATSTAASTVTIGATTYDVPATTIRIGIGFPVAGGLFDPTTGNEDSIQQAAALSTDIFYEDNYLEWTAGESGEKTLSIDISHPSIQSNFPNLQLSVVSIAPWTEHSGTTGELYVDTTADNIFVEAVTGSQSIQAADGFEINSSTWNAYKANTPAENNNNHYANHSHDDHDHIGNERYGLEPSHAQTNGSFYIDDRLGKIHFSSNISGKTVILDYISDSLGTDGEMQVPKLAEDAIYKHILYDLISTRSNIGGSRLSFHKREKFAAVRKAKLRLSSIKLEELTQILRGQSKHIKH